MGEAKKKFSSDTPALSLSTTEFDRPTVSIDVGEGPNGYLMRAEDELSVAMVRRLRDLSKISQDPEEELESKAEAIENAVDCIMVDFPVEIRDQLTIRQLGRIVETFTELVGDDKSASEVGPQAVEAPADESPTD